MLESGSRIMAVEIISWKAETLPEQDPGRHQAFKV